MTKPKPNSILIVEDDDDIRENLKFALEFENYSVVEARHGLEAIEALNRQGDEIALILLDLMMPVMDGRNFLKEINATGLYTHIPLVVFTASPETVETSIKNIIKKPFELDQILALAQKYCTKSSMTLNPSAPV